MLNGKYVDSDLIIEELYRDYGFDEEIFVDEVLEWIYDVIAISGVPMYYIDIILDDSENSDGDPITITSFRGTLPTNLYSIVLCRDSTTKMPMLATSRNFMDDESVNVYESQYTYEVKEGYIYTSFEEGSIDIQYKAFPTTALGLPKVPDEKKLINAIKSYIAHKIARRIKIRGGSFPSDIYNEIQQEYAWYIGGARTKAHMPSYDKMEAIKNRWLRLVQNPDLHQTSFRYLPDKERLILHNNATNLYKGNIYPYTR